VILPTVSHNSLGSKSYGLTFCLIGCYILVHKKYKEYAMPHSSHPLSKTAISDSINILIRLNGAGQTAFPKLTNGMCRTAKEDAEQAVLTLSKFQLTVFDKMYSVLVGGEVQNVMLEKRIDGLFSNQFLDLLLSDLECTTITKEDFMAFVDVNPAAVQRDCAFVRDFLPKSNAFFANSEYDNSTLITKIKNESAQSTQSASVGAEVSAGLRWLGIGAKVDTKAQIETANTNGTQTSTASTVSPYLKSIERGAILTVGFAYMLDKIHDIQHPEWPKSDTMRALNTAKQCTDNLVQSKDDPAALQKMVADGNMFDAFNTLNVVNNNTWEFASILVEYGYREFLERKRADVSQITREEGFFWYNLNRALKDKSLLGMSSEMRYILNHQDTNPLLVLVSGAIGSCEMTDTTLSEFKTAINKSAIKESYISGDVYTETNPQFVYCPELLSAKADYYNCEPDNLVFFSNPCASVAGYTNDKRSVGVIAIDRLADLFPDAAKSLSFNSENPESSVAFISTVNANIESVCLENAADFIIELQPVSSEIGRGGIIAEHKIRVCYTNADGDTLPLTPEGLRYSGAAQSIELTYPISELNQQKKYLEKLNRETKMKEGFKQSVAENGVASLAELLKRRIDPAITPNAATKTAGLTVH
jgi:hypothetical protein